MFTVDEGDHFVGVSKTGCDGVNTPCDYGPGEIGELNANIDTLVSNQFPSLASQFLGAAAPNSFTVHGDDAPPFYLTHKAATGGGPFDQTDPLTRTFERDIAGLTAVNAYTGNTDQLAVRMADQAGMKALHMFTTGDPGRNAQFVLFANPNYFLTDFPASTCLTCINPAFAWNHGDIQPEIATTWVGYVGPGVRNLGESNEWTDHADVRPTMLSLLGLSDDYAHDGVVVPAYLDDSALPKSLRVAPGDAAAPRRRLQAAGRAVRAVRQGHPQGVHGRARERKLHERLEVHVDREQDLDADRPAGRRRRADPEPPRRRPSSAASS